MPTGLTASQTITLTGQSASSFGQEVVLAIDPAGDRLQIDAAGDVLIVTPSIMNFTGVSASTYGAEVDLAIDANSDLLTIDAGGDALIVTPNTVGDRAVPLEGQGWVAFETEGGQAIETEGLPSGLSAEASA